MDNITGLLLKSYEKSKESICKDCLGNEGFNGEFYDCSNTYNVTVEYEDDGTMFHTKIIKCTHYYKKK